LRTSSDGFPRRWYYFPSDSPLKIFAYAAAEINFFCCEPADDSVPAGVSVLPAPSKENHRNAIARSSAMRRLPRGWTALDIFDQRRVKAHVLTPLAVVSGRKIVYPLRP